jgi:hypothetical protein
VPSNEGIFVITGSVQTVLAARHHLENIQSLVFVKEYNIL